MNNLWSHYLSIVMDQAEAVLIYLAKIDHFPQRFYGLKADA
ncbi:hypothetical protein AB1L05_00670 [Cytobacillus horneckiae]